MRFEGAAMRREAERNTIQNLKICLPAMKEWRLITFESASSQIFQLSWHVNTSALETIGQQVL